jgi:histone-lysine N-methyltransferase SETMAR
MVQTRGGTKTYFKEKSALQNINDCVWWDMEGIIYELLGPNKTINSEVYCQQLDRVNECLKEKRPLLVNRKGVVFHQDNARPHVTK